MALDKTEKIKALIVKLYEINAVKFGIFKMKVGYNSPIYFDLRVIVSYPNVMEAVAELLIAVMEEQGIRPKHVCGVPYTALPMATIVSIRQQLPMLVRRKEAKNYGTKKIIEGIYSSGDSCLIIEDVITSGSSVLETVRDLKNEGIVVDDAIVVIDREQGGAANITKNGVKIHSLFTLSYLLQTLQEADKITQQTVDDVQKYISSLQINSDGSKVNGERANVSESDRMKLSFENRASMAKNVVAKRLFELMATKKTNLCLAADLTSSQQLLDIADKCGPYICLLKTHIDIVSDFDESLPGKLRALAKQHDFVLMEDRKFADIGNTVSLQYSKGVYQISSWAELVTAHTLPGSSILKGLKAAFSNTALTDAATQRGVFLVNEMSASGNLIDDLYKEKSRKLATEGPDVDFVAGVVCQSKDSFDFPGIIQLTPGVKIADNADSLGQQYQSPEQVIMECGADIAVVGRGILQAENAAKTAALYRDQLWAAYCARIGGI